MRLQETCSSSCPTLKFSDLKAGDVYRTPSGNVRMKVTFSSIQYQYTLDPVSGRCYSISDATSAPEFRVKELLPNATLVLEPGK